MKRRYGHGMRVAVLGLLVATANASACGVCIEDKVAVTYDHAVVSQALARRHVVVFTAIEGNADAQVLVRVKQAAARARGVAPRSVRASTDPGALSFALDPSLATPEAAVAVIEQSASGVRLSVLRIVR